MSDSRLQNDFAKAVALPEPVDVRLFDAVHAVDVAAARRAIAEGANVNHILSSGWTPLMKALRTPHADRIGMVRLLLQSGADTQAFEALPGMPKLLPFLHTETVYKGPHFFRDGEEEALALLLIAHGADANAVLAQERRNAPTGKTPVVTFYIRAGMMQALDAALAAGADPHSVETPDGIPPLVAAIQAVNGRAVDILVRHGALPDRGAGMITTPVVAALYHSDERLIRLFLSKGADPMRYNDYTGETPVDVALRGNHDALPWLLSQGADIARVAPDGTTVLHRILMQPDYDMRKLAATLRLDGIEAVLSTSVAAGKHAGKTPLHLAVENPVFATERVFALLHAGADPCALYDGMTPAQYARRLFAADKTGIMDSVTGRLDLAANAAQVAASARAPKPTPAPKGA